MPSVVRRWRKVSGVGPGCYGVYMLGRKPTLAAQLLLLAPLSGCPSALLIRLSQEAAGDGSEQVREAGDGSEQDREMAL